jgi:hypothetical protein
MVKRQPVTPMECLRKRYISGKIKESTLGSRA